MKKRFSIIALLLVLVVTFVTFGCKEATDLDMSKVKKWNDLQILGSKDLNHCIELKADNEAIDWWIITDENGIVLEPGTDYEFVNSKGGASSGTESSTIVKGGSIYLKFNIDKAIVVWIHQSNVAPKEGEKGTKDFRGRVDIKWADQGYEVKASKYREEVPRVGIIALTCDETAKDGSTGNGITTKGNFYGNYRITEVWPLSQKENSPEWEATSGLKFIFDEGKYIEEGKTKRLVYPANEPTVIALKQPDRFTERDDADTVEKQKDWYWCLPFCSSDDITIADDPNTTTNEPSYKTLNAHDTVEVASSDCVFYFKLGAFYKSVMGENYIVEEFVSSSEK